MDVATGLPAFTNPFATPNMQQLIARQVEHNDGHCLLNTPFVIIFSLWDQHWKVELPLIHL
jgi:hypothetical protein